MGIKKENSISAHSWIYSISGLLVVFGLIIWITGGFTFELLGNRVSVQMANHPFSYAIWVLIAGLVFTKDRLGFPNLFDKIQAFKTSQILFVLLSITAFFELGHFIAPLNSAFWNLDSESGLATYYQSAMLFSTGACVFMLYQKERLEGIPKPSGWLPILVVFWGLAIDELVAFHNGMPKYLSKLGLYSGGGSTNFPMWVVFLAPLALAVVIYLISFILKRFKGKKGLLLLSLLALVVWVLAYLSELLLVTSLNHQLQVGIEEGAELLGTSLFFCVFAGYKSNYAKARKKNKK